MAQSSPFKPCDVRGVYPTEVNEALMAAIGRALPAVLPLAGSVVLGGDARISTPSLLPALTAAVASRQPIAAVLQPFATPGLYYVGEALGAAATLVVTASHNPPSHNGLKLLVGGEALSQEDMRRLAAAANAEAAAAQPERADRWCSDVAAWAQRYADRLLALAPVSRPLNLVVDAGNGCLGGLAADTLRRAGHTVIEINGDVDGRFLGRGPDPTAPGAVADLAATVVDSGADAGMAFDGDGDRVVFVDGGGDVVPPDAISAILAVQAVATGVGPVVLDVRTSRLLTLWLRQQGADVVPSRPGHAFVRSQLRGRHARFGAEVSGHYFFAELGGDDALFATLRLAALIGDAGPLASLVHALPPWYVRPEARIPYVGPVAPVLTAIGDRLKPASTEDFGGGLVHDLGDAWVVARASITEPLLAIRCEASSERRLREVMANVDGALRQFGLSLH